MLRTIRLACLVCVAIVVTSCTAADPPTGNSTSAVINGTVDNGDPAVVALMEGGQFFCSGTLIAPRVVLTAAHCLEGGSAGQLSIFFGTDSTNPSSGQQVPVRAILAHPQYQGWDHDIGLIELDAAGPATPIERNTTALAATMAGQDVRVVGFGVSVDGGDGSGIKRTGLTTFDSLESDYFYVRAKNQQSGCYGDSGGPNFMTLGGAEVLAGVTSFGTEDSCLAGLGGNTDVATYNTWIDENTANVDPGGPTCLSGDGCLAGCATPDPDCPGDPGDPPGDDDDDGDDGDGDDDDDGGATAGGCAAGGRAGEGGAVLLIALAGLVRRRRRR